MRKLLTILALFCFLGTTAQTKYYVGKVPVGQHGKLLDPSSWGGVVKGGDTLMVMDTDGYRKGYLALTYFYGTSNGLLSGTMDTTRPIVVMAGGTDTTWIGALSLTGCKNIKVTGRGKPGINYGFGGGEGSTGSAIIIDGRSSWIEVEKYFVKDALYIAQIKQDNRCPDSAINAAATPWGDSLNYAGGFRMSHIRFHNNGAVNIYGDGVYAGNTAPTAGYATPCQFPVQGWVSFSSIPMRMANIRIDHDTIYHVGRTAIQLSGADSGFNSIDSNYSYGSGYEINNQQGAHSISGGMSSNLSQHHNTYIASYHENVTIFGTGNQYVDDNYLDSAGVIPFTVYDKQTITNTDTGYARIHCYYDYIDPAVTKVKIYHTKISGTVNSYAYIVGIPFASEAKISDTARETTPTAYVPCSDTVHFSNVASQSYQFTVTGNYQFWKVIIKQTGTQVNNYRCYVINSQYNFGIGVDDKVTSPAHLPLTVYLRRNTFGLTDSLRGGVDITIGDSQFGSTGFSAYTGANIICNNFRISGAAAVLSNSAGITFSTNCSGGSSSTYYNYLRLKRGVRVNIRQ